MFLRDLNRLLSVFRFVIIETWWAVRERNMVTQWDEDRSPYFDLIQCIVTPSKP